MQPANASTRFEFPERANEGSLVASFLTPRHAPDLQEAHTVGECKIAPGKSAKSGTALKYPAILVQSFSSWGFESGHWGRGIQMGDR